MVIGLIAYVVLFFADGSIFTAPIQSLWRGATESFGLEWRGCLIFFVILVLEFRYKPGVLWLLSSAGVLGYLLFLF